ncbi:MAG TPA: glycosyltransferase [Candidatus Paceibacterota bacterium]
MNVTLVIPVFNEAEVILPTLSLLCDVFERESGLRWSIIVADNGSTDGTGDLVAHLANDRISLLHLDEKGKGGAVRMAFTKADGDIVAFTDADLSVSPEDIVAAIKFVASDATDVVVGSRLLSKSRVPGREWWRTASSRAFNFAARLVVGLHKSDIQCPLKVMNGKGVKVMLATKESTWFFDLEFLALAEHLLLRVVEVPVTWNEHRYPKRKSKLKAGDSIRALFAMLRIRQRLPTQVSLLEQRR